ncbi:MAG TPA: EamA family transporter [Lacisediminihabitans sp.]|uniref:DMT family transporter n=1 Tax=Lacisediminihabitans sp. TaxID=2787631 RepID=UPI002ED7DD90
MDAGITVGDRRTGVPALVAASVLWGTTGTAASLLPPSVSPLAVGAATMTVGGLLLFAFSARSAVRALRARASRPWLLLGAVGVVVYPLAFYSAMGLAGVAVGNVVSLGSGPVFAALFEWVWERRRPTSSWFACTLVAVLGIGLLAWSGAAADSSRPAGVALGLLAGLCYALYTYASSRAIGRGGSARGVMGGLFGAGAVLLVPVLLLLGAPLLQSSATVAIGLYLAIGPMFVAYLFFGVGLRSIHSSRATTITLIEPIVATVLAVLVVGERPSLGGWIGLALVLGAVAVVATARQPDESPSAPYHVGHG